MPDRLSKHTLKLRPLSLAIAAATCLPLAGNPVLADNLLVGSGGDGGVSTGSFAAGSGGGGGIGGGGGGGGSGVSGGAGGGSARGGNGLTGTGSRGGTSAGSDGGTGGASGSSGGQAGAGGGGGAAGNTGSTGGGGSGAGGLGAGGGQGNGGAGGDGGSIVDIAGATFAGTASQGAQAASSGAISSSTAYDYVGVGGGGGGAGKIVTGNNGSAGSLTVSNATLTVNRSLLLGGGGGGGTLSADGGRGGDGSLTLMGAGLSVANTLLIGGAGGGNGGSYTGSGSGAGGQGGNGTLTVAGNSTVSIGTGARLVLGGGAGGGAGVLNLGQGTANFAGGGSFTINTNGTLNIGSDTPGASVGGTINNLSTLVNNGRINFNQAGTGSYILTSSISGSGSVAVDSAGSTVLLGDNTYTGGTTVSAGTLQIGAAGPTGSIRGDIVNNASVVFSRSGALNYAGAMSGSGSLTKAGTGMLTLSGASTATGNVYVSNGGLELTGSAARLGGATSRMHIGSTGDALLTVSNAAQLTSQDAEIGSVSGGTAIVTGASSTWTANYVYVGYGASGELRVLDGGQLSALRSFVGTYANGHAVVSGANTVWTSTTGILLGNTAGTTGSVVVEKGGTASASRVEIGGGGGAVYVYGLDATARGVLQTGPIIRHAGTTSGTVDFDGGILRAAAAEADIFQGFGAGDVTLGASGLYLDSNGYDVGISTVLDGAGRLNKTGTGTLTLSGANTYTGGTAVQAGVLVTGASQVLGSGAVDISAGATLDLGGNAQSVSGLAGAGEVRLGSATLTLGAGNGSALYAGVVSGTGGLRKLGTGTFFLSGVNAYSGATQIDGGALVVNGSIANSAVTVGSGARLGGSGTVGSTTVASGGVLAPGNSLGSLRVAGDFTLAAGGTLDYELGAPGTGAAAPGASDHLQVDGNVSLNGTLSLSDSAAAAGLGYYRLISYGGVLSGTGLQLGSIPPSLASSNVRVVSEVAGHLDLRVSAPGSNLLQTWTGGNGAWTSAGADWVNDGGSVSETWAGNHAVFLTAGGGTVDVQGAQSFAGLQFVADGYRLNGAGTLETRAAGSELRVLGGAAATIDTVISGTGGIDKTQGGTLTLNGANTYAGGTTVSGGVLSVSSDGNLGAASGGLTLNGGTLRIADAAYQGTARSLALGAAGGALDLPSDFTLQGAVSGAGALNKTGAGMLTLASDSSAYAGTATVSAGGLALADGARLGGSLQVAQGAYLAGSGTLGSAAIAAGAVHAPGGDAIGTQTFTGDYVNHGTLRIDAMPTRHDSVVVAGGVDITGATLDLRLSPAEASAWSAVAGPYTLISKQSAGAVAGGFAAVNNPLLFLDASVNTAGGDGNDVTLTLARNERSVASAARTPNQRAVATAIDSLPQSHDVWRVAMLSNDASQLQQGLDQLSGDTHASVVSGLMNATPVAPQAGLARLRVNLSAPMLPGAASAQAGASDAPAAASLLPRSGASPLWAQVTGDWQRQRGDGNAPGVDQNSAGVVVGGDVGVGQGWRIGGAFGYTDARLRPEQRTATAKTQSYTATVYGGKSFATGAGAINVLAGAAYSWHDIDTRRQVRYGMDQNLTASYSGNTRQLFAEAGYSLAVTPAVTLEPFIGVSWSDLRVRGFSESGGSAALSGSAQSQDTTSTLAGLRGQWAPAETDLVLRAMLGWRHAYGSLRPTQTLAFDQGASFSVAGAPIARDAARVELGADLVVVRNMTAGLSYGGEFGGGNRQHAGSVDVRWRF